MKLSLFSFLLVPLGITGCRKAEPAPTFVLPAATQTGANTLGFTIDGRVWQNYGRTCTFYGCHDNKLTAYVGPDLAGNGREVQISAGLTARDVNEYFDIDLNFVRGPGTYSPHKSSHTGAYNRIYLGGETLSQTYESMDSSTTRVIITRLDTAAHVISGTFEGLLQRRDKPSDSRTIQDGRFDIVYSK